VRPDGEAPRVGADEVGVGVRDAEVVDRREQARVGERFDGKPRTVERRELVAGLQLAGRRPAAVADVERVLSGGRDDPPRDPSDPRRHSPFPGLGIVRQALADKQTVAHFSLL